MDPSEAELQVHLRGMEEADRILPNFFQFDQVGSITSPFDAGLIDTDKGELEKRVLLVIKLFYCLSNSPKLSLITTSIDADNYQSPLGRVR